MRPSLQTLLIAAFIIAAEVVLAADTGGISAARARRLASDYMTCYINGCGGVEEPIARADYWEVPVRSGIIGAREGAIHVDRRTGVVSYRWRGTSHPTLSPKELDQVIKRIFYSRKRP